MYVCYLNLCRNQFKNPSQSVENCTNTIPRIASRRKSSISEGKKIPIRRVWDPWILWETRDYVKLWRSQRQTLLSIWLLCFFLCVCYGVWWYYLVLRIHKFNILAPNLQGLSSQSHCRVFQGLSQISDVFKSYASYYDAIRCFIASNYMFTI